MMAANISLFATCSSVKKLILQESYIYYTLVPEGIKASGYVVVICTMINMQPHSLAGSAALSCILYLYEITLAFNTDLIFSQLSQVTKKVSFTTTTIGKSLESSQSWIYFHPQDFL